jgi:hypothetical protein
MLYSICLLPQKCTVNIMVQKKKFVTIVRFKFSFYTVRRKYIYLILELHSIADCFRSWGGGREENDVLSFKGDCHFYCILDKLIICDHPCVDYPWIILSLKVLHVCHNLLQTIVAENCLRICFAKTFLQVS